MNKPIRGISAHKDILTAGVGQEIVETVVASRTFSLSQDTAAPLDPFAAVRPYVDSDLKVPLEALPNPERFNLIVKPVGIKKKIGSIILADQTVDDQQWTHGTAVVCKVGPSVFRGQRFKDMGLEPRDGPKVGDLVYIMPRNPNRFEVDKELYLLIADDGIFARLDPKHAHRITYKL